MIRTQRGHLVSWVMVEKLRRSAHASWCKLGEEGAVLDKREGLYFRLNSSATLIWESLQKPQSKDALIDRLVENWSISQADASNDIDIFLAEMQALGLVELDQS